MTTFAALRISLSRSQRGMSHSAKGKDVGMSDTARIRMRRIRDASHGFVADIP
jgi:hypothetical protein